jgi:hypothetical protein
MLYFSLDPRLIYGDLYNFTDLLRRLFRLRYSVTLFVQLAVREFNSRFYLLDILANNAMVL